MRKKLLFAAKLIWLAVVAGALVWYMRSHWAEFVDYAGRIGIGPIAASVLMLLLAKLLLSQISADALRMFSVRLPFWKVFHIYALSQMGKYLPGSIWQYVGRVMLYRAEGMPAKVGTKVILVESFWLFGSAGALGAAACAERLVALAGLSEAAWMPPPAAISLTALALLLVGLWGGTRLFAQRFGGEGASAPRIFLLELATWLVLGLSFWFLFPAEVRRPDYVMLAVGAFALGWAGGYLAIFAPAGVGVREVIIVALVTHVMSVPVAVAAVALSRLLYSATDLALGAIAAMLYRAGTRTVANLVKAAAPAGDAVAGGGNP